MNLRKTLAVSALALSSLSTTLSGQVFEFLDPVAAKYDLFITAGPNAGDENDRNYMDWKKSKKGSGGGFDGLMGLGQNSWNWIEDGVQFSGTLNRHTQLYQPDLNIPSSLINQSTAINADLAAADAEIKSYINYLKSLSTTQSFGNLSSSFTYNTSQPVSVLDFSSIDMNGSGDKITLNGQAGQSNKVVIRISGDAYWEDGAPIELNNLDQRNVIWLSTNNNSEFDLHKNDGANFEGVIFNHSSVPQGDYTTIIGDVDFKGQVYASHIKLGTDAYIQGSSTFGPPIPEPSGTILFLAACGGAALVRRRK